MNNIKKITRGDNVCFVVAIIFIILIMLCAFWAYRISKIDLGDPKYLYKINTSDEYVYINGNDYPMKFASDDTYYYTFVPYFYTENEKTYYDVAIAAFEKGKYDKIIKAYDEAEDDDEIIVEGVSYTGVSKHMETDLRNLAVESYPEIFDEEMNENEFDEYFGSYYILVDANPKDYTDPICIAIILFAIGGYFMYRGFISKVRNKNIFNSDIYMKAIEELEMPLYETKRAILTNNYIVFADCGIKIVPYSDITWIYKHTFRYNGVPNHSLAYHIKGSKKKYLISYGINEKTVDELLTLIADKNKDALAGYTAENIKLYKEMV